MAAAIFVYAIVAADKKIRLVIAGFVIVAASIIYALPNLRYRFITPFYGETSANSRIILWKAGWNSVKNSPITGLGLTGFSHQYRSLVPDPNLDTHNYPHNIFLDVWVETGLLGLLSFTAIVIIYIYQGLRAATLKNTDTSKVSIKLPVALFLVALITQGLIDNPYFKNDLALVFWLVLSFIF